MVEHRGLSDGSRAMMFLGVAVGVAIAVMLGAIWYQLFVLG